MKRYLAMNRYIGVDSYRKEEKLYSLQLKGLRPLISYVNSLERRTSQFYFLEFSKESNVYPCNIHTTWQWAHSGKRLRICKIVCWWRKHMAQIESWKNENIDVFYTKTTQKGGFSKLCVKIKKRCYTDLLHFSTCIR